MTYSENKNNCVLWFVKKINAEKIYRFLLTQNANLVASTNLSDDFGIFGQRLCPDNTINCDSIDE